MVLKVSTMAELDQTGESIGLLKQTSTEPTMEYFA